MTSRTVTVRRIPIHCEELGEGRPVVLVHGFSLGARTMRHHYEPVFAARRDGGAGWRRIYLDMPGHGETPGPEWLTTDDEMLEILVELVDGLTDGERFVILGQSWGAYLGHALACRRADRVDGLMMTVPLAHADRETRDVPAPTVLVHDPAVDAEITPDEELWPFLAVVQTPEMLAAFRQPADALPPDEAFLERLGPGYPFSFEAELTTTIPAPALIVAGRQDSVVGYRDTWPLLDHLPRATFAVLDRAGHALEQEQRPLLHALAHEWLDRVEEYAAPSGPPDAA